MSFFLYSGALYREAVSYEDLEYRAQRFFWGATKYFRDVLATHKAELTELAKVAAEQFPGDIEAQRGYFMEQAQSLYYIPKLIKRFDLKQPGAKDWILRKVSNVFIDKQNIDAVEDSLVAPLRPYYKKKQKDRGKAQLKRKARFPEEFVTLLPRAYALKIGPDHKIVAEYSIWGNKFKDELAKSAAMAKILKDWNKLVDRLNQDLNSPDPFVRLCTIIASIILHTGVRPGVEGESYERDDHGNFIRDADGTPLRKSTYGASGLKIEHIQFLRDDFARLEFPGKDATDNVATLDDPTLIKALKAHVESVRAGGGDSVFVLKNGAKITDSQINDYIGGLTQDQQQVTDEHINKYLREILGEEVQVSDLSNQATESRKIQASDFRKLQATRVYFNSLQARKSILAANIKALKAKTKAQFRQEAIRLIRAHIRASLTEAQVALSHRDLRTTIDSYIEPKVTIAYLTDAGMEFSMEQCVGDGRGMEIHFDFKDFYKKVLASEPLEAEASTHEAWSSSGTTFSPGERFIDFSPNETLRWLELDKGSQKPAQQPDSSDIPEQKAASAVPQHIRYRGTTYRKFPG